ncbi:MAG: hypothetical protein AB1714_27100 [Acidobacteriota bacterium]
MAVRIRLKITGQGEQPVITTAVLNGGFEVAEPHLLLPARCAGLVLGDYRSSAVWQSMEAAGGQVDFLLASDTVNARAVTADREGHEVSFKILVSDADPEVLVSDAGIDALGLRIESFAPGRWRFADQTLIRETEPPQYW